MLNTANPSIRDIVLGPKNNNLLTEGMLLDIFDYQIKNNTPCDNGNILLLYIWYRGDGKKIERRSVFTHNLKELQNLKYINDGNLLPKFSE